MLWKVVAAGMAVYLLLLARSAWVQGELKQFLRALAVVVLLLLTLAGIVFATIWLDRR